MNQFSIFIEKKGIVGEKKNILYNGLITNPRVKISEQRNVCDYIFIDFRDFDALGKYTMEHFKKMIVIEPIISPNKNNKFKLKSLNINDISMDWNIAFNSAEKRVTTTNNLHNTNFLEYTVSFCNRKEQKKKERKIPNIPIKLPNRWTILKSKVNP